MSVYLGELLQEESKALLQISDQLRAGRLIIMSCETEEIIKQRNIHNRLLLNAQSSSIVCLVSIFTIFLLSTKHIQHEIIL